MSDGGLKKDLEMAIFGPQKGAYWLTETSNPKNFMMRRFFRDDYPRADILAC